MAEETVETEISCAVCGHAKSDHAEFIDNTTASASYVPQRRHCMVQDEQGNCCPCGSFKTGVPEMPKWEEAKRMVGADRGANIVEVAGVMETLIVDPLSDVPAEGPNVRTNPICDNCLNSKYPGILWPVRYKQHSLAWVLRCTKCNLFKDDHSAAYFLSAVTGLPIHLGMYDGEYNFFTPIDEALVESMARALRIG